MNTDLTLITFKAICNFVNDLSDVYGPKHKPLRLYKTLVNKTQIVHDTSIKKHVTAFTQFCVVNRDAIAEKDEGKITEKNIIYSERVYINMGHIFNIADNETKPVIWQHLLTISAIVDPISKAKQILKQSAENASADEKTHNEFLTDMITKVEQTVRPDASPVEAMASIMQSGVFTEMFSGIQQGFQTGKLDMSKLLGTVQSMLSSVGENADPETKNTMDSLGNMVNNVGNNMNSGTAPDMSAMLNMMTGMMSGLNQTNQTNQTNKNIEK